MKEKYMEDLKEIKDMMNRSSRFLSLSGWSGISAGMAGLAGAFLAYVQVYQNEGSQQTYEQVTWSPEKLSQLLVIAGGTLMLALGTGIFFTTRKTILQGHKIWDHQTKRILINLAIPLVTGGIFCLTLLTKGFVGMVAPLTLIFYGLALVNVSKYTVEEMRSLGILEIILGLVAMQAMEWGLLLWALGFGVLHIVYGIMLQLKYKS